MLPAVLASLAVLVALLLFVPFDARLVLERNEAARARVEVAWLFGVVRFRVPGSGPSRPRKDAKAKGRRKRGRSRSGRRYAMRLLRPGVAARARELVAGLLRSLRPRDLHVRARIGLDDPADTGCLWGAVGPLAALFSGQDVRVEPAFDGACLRYRACARVRVVPGWILWLLARFLVSPPVLRAVVAG